jgi:hypothetical protein
MNTYLCVIVSKTKRQLPVLGNAPKKLNTKKTPPRMPVARPLRACRQSSSPEPLLQTAAVSVPQGKETEESNPSAVVSTQLNINKELEALKAEMKQAKIERDLQAQMYKDQLAKVEAEYAAFKASREIHATPAPVAAPATPVTSSCPPAQSSQHQHATVWWKHVTFWWKHVTFWWKHVTFWWKHATICCKHASVWWKHVTIWWDAVCTILWTTSE